VGWGSIDQAWKPLRLDGVYPHCMAKSGCFHGMAFYDAAFSALMTPVNSLYPLYGWVPTDS
jgi:hypothetical protein